MLNNFKNLREGIAREIPEESKNSQAEKQQIWQVKDRKKSSNDLRQFITPSVIKNVSLTNEISENKYRPLSPNPNCYMSPLKKNNSSLNFSSNTINNTINSKQETKEVRSNHITEKSITKKPSIGDRLNESQKLIKIKLENIRYKDEIERKRNFTPTISTHAKKIMRDPNLFSERLYPFYENGTRKNLNNSLSYNSDVDFFHENKKVADLYGKDSFVNLYRKSGECKADAFNYTPKISQKSKLIAAKMEPAMIRLTRNKKKSQSIYKNSKDLSLLSYSINSSFVKNTDNDSDKFNLHHSHTVKSIFKSKELYDRGIESIKKKTIVYEENKKNRDEEYKKYSFSPMIHKFGRSNSKISLNSKSTLDHEKYFRSQNPKNTNLSPYEKQQVWKKNIQNRNQTLKIKSDEQKIKECTFKPKVDLNIPDPDITFIGKNLRQMQTYILNRRKSLQKQEEEKKYAHNKLYKGDNFCKKPTLIKEFPLSESKSRKSYVTTNKPVYNHTPDSVNKMRKKLSTEIYFEEQY
jgi:hypothetical protein